MEGHSLGAMATWEWALNNPERFAAISPRAGRGEPYRASRLRRVPAWVIHGENDDVVFTGFSDQMVTALEDCGAPVRYSILSGVGHNMPDDLDEPQVVDWYLRQTRDPGPPPADPRDALGISDAGFSAGEIVETREIHYWKSEPVAMGDRDASLRAVQTLFHEARAHGERVDSPLIERLETKSNLVTFWLAAPGRLQRNDAPPAGTVAVPAARYIRWYFRGETPKALEHAARVAAEAHDHGPATTAVVWITPMSLWPETPSYLAEYRIEIP